jgi:CRISPR-associated protein (TIGR02710 family)
VISGSEKIYSSLNPWDFLANDDFIRFCDFFDGYQFSSAVLVIDNILNKTTKYKLVFEVMRQIVDAYKLWDLFRHKESYRVFNKINLKYLRDFEKYNFNKVIDIIEKNIKFIEALHDLKSVSILYIYDLISNADRRYEEGKIDDAILRLYRAVEMIAQLNLKENYNIDSSKVKKQQVPEKIRDEFQKKYSDADSENLKLPLFASFILLKQLGNEIGKKFFENQDEFKKVLSLRNNSYLAHGYQSSKEAVYTEFRTMIISLFTEFNEDNLPKFPKLSKVLYS